VYERFTDRARKVMQLANQEAQRLNHEYIGCEHILLGLIAEGSGLAINVLKNLDIDLKKVKQGIVSHLIPGPSMVTMGKLPQTPGARKVIELSIQHAKELNDNHIGTEHILLGLLSEGGSLACKVLVELGASLEKVREEILILTGHQTEREPLSKVPEQPKDIREYREMKGVCVLRDGTFPTVDVPTGYRRVQAHYILAADMLSFVYHIVDEKERLS
jgi:ATP-dependent Clp protease ATP-binding subunit ClpC